MAKKTLNINSDFIPKRWQRDVINGVYNNFKGFIHCVKSARQLGKSTVLETILLKTALENNKTVSICMSPTSAQAEKIFKELVDIVLPTPLYKASNAAKLSINLLNGSVILFKSAEQDEAALQGYTVSGILCIDEAAYIADDVFYAILPWVRVHSAPILMTSTPRYKEGFFYKYYQLGFENGNKVLSYDWLEYDTSELLSEEDKETLRKQLPRDKYLSQVLGVFLDQEGTVFGDFSNVVGSEVSKSTVYYFGIDWGSGVGGDETAVAIFNGDKQMVALEHWNDKDETETIKSIVELCKKYQPIKVTVEVNSIGRVFYGLLSKAIKGLGIRLCEFNTTNDSKQKLVNGLQVAIQNGEVQLLDDRNLQLEMAMYEMKLSKNGKPTYNAASGYHDDLVIATMIGLHSISVKGSDFRFA